MNRTLAKAFPHVYCELDFTNPLELTVATILSAQSTDKGVNLTTPALFARYRTALDYARADRVELEELVRPTGFYRNKANSLIRLGQELVARFDGAVPRTMAELVTLPGVGRKTANVILGNAFGVPGITVDTHFQRLVHRWQLTTETDPVKVEKVIGGLIERRDWTDYSHRVIFHGRRVCHARKPACGVCFIARDCPSYGEGPVEKEAAAKLEAERAEEISLDADFVNKRFARIDQSIAVGALFTAHHLGCKAIVALSESGSTALWMSRYKIHVPIYGLTTQAASQRKMALYRNIRPMLMPRVEDRDNALKLAESILVEKGVLKPGDTYAITCGEPMGYPGGTNMLKVCEVR